MRIISYDVGIKNLAYCICDEKMTIIKWDIIDLLNVNNKCSFCSNNADTLFYKYKLCKEHKNKQSELKEPYLDLDKNDKSSKCIVCSKTAKCKIGNDFMCNLHKKSFENKNYKIKETNVSCDKISTAQFKYNLVTAIDNMPELLEVDTVLIENQPSFKNPKMKAIADTLFGYYLIRGVFDKKNFDLDDIHLIAPSQKLKLEAVKEIEKEKGVIVDEKKNEKKNEKKEEKKEKEGDEKKAVVKMTYKQGKDFAIKKCISLIDDQYKEYLSTHKKKDDLCDCYLQAYHYLTKVKKIII
jgi:cellobiose-specific phosphotransferase system component IIB